MYLNTLQPAFFSKKSSRRVGRGIGSGKGKTCSKGHKGQKSRSGGYHKVGFEGGQMPLKRRIPKSYFGSMKSMLRKEVRLSELKKIKSNIVDLVSLKKFGIINSNIRYVKIFGSSRAFEKVITIQKGIFVSKGAKVKIISAGGKIEE